MVFDAHERAFHFFKGVAKRGIYDMLTAVDAVFVGKERQFRRSTSRTLRIDNLSAGIAYPSVAAGTAIR